MGWQTEIVALRRELGAIGDTIAGRIFKWLPLANTSPMGDADTLRTSDDGPDNQMPVGRVEPWGLRSRAVARGVRAFALKLGDSNVFFIGVAPTKGYGPNDLDEGETALYAISKAVVRLWKTGRLTLDSDAEDVVVNGGTAKVARVGDHTASHNHTITFTLTAPPGGGAVTGTITANNVAVAIAEGAPNFKA